MNFKIQKFWKSYRRERLREFDKPAASCLSLEVPGPRLLEALEALGQARELRGLRRLALRRRRRQRGELRLGRRVGVADALELPAGRLPAPP